MCESSALGQVGTIRVENTEKESSMRMDMERLDTGTVEIRIHISFWQRLLICFFGKGTDTIKLELTSELREEE